MPIRKFAGFLGNVCTFASRAGGGGQIFGWIVLSVGLASGHSCHLESSSLGKPRFQNGSCWATEEEHWLIKNHMRAKKHPPRYFEKMHNFLYLSLKWVFLDWVRAAGQYEVGVESKVAKKKLCPHLAAKLKRQEGSLGWNTNQSTPSSIKHCVNILGG